MPEGDSPEQQREHPPEQHITIPPASFEFLVLSLRSQAEFQMGLMHFGPENERPEPDLDLARHSIDLLGVLQEKTKGNLGLEEQRLLENSLTELRFRYIQAADQKTKSAGNQASGA